MADQAIRMRLRQRKQGVVTVVPWRVIIEGRMVGLKPHDAKALLAKRIKGAAQRLPGAEVLRVTTRRRSPKKRAKKS